MATSSPKAAKTATPKTPAPAAAKKASAAKPTRKTAAAAQPAEPVAATAAPSAVVAPAAKKAPKAAAKTPAKAASKPAGQPTLKQAAAKAAPAVSAAPEPAPAKKAAAKTAAKTAAKKAANQAGQVAAAVAAAVVAVAEPVAEPPAAPRAAARKTRAASAVPKAAAPAQGAETAAAASPAAKPKAAPKPAGKVAGKTAGKAATKKVATEAPANTPTLTPAVDVAGSDVATAAPKAPRRTAAKRPAKSAETEAVAPAPAVEPPAPQHVNEPEAPQADAAIASTADAPAADAPAPAEPPQGGARTGGRSRGERGGRGRRDGRGERDNRNAAGGRATGDGGAGGTAGGGAEAGAAERDKPVGDAPGGERRDGRPAAGNRPRRPEPMSLDERAARSKQAMALAEAETANPTPAAPDAAEGEHAAPSPAAAPTEQRDSRDRERGQRRGRGRDRDRPSTPPPAGTPAADTEPTTGATAAPATVYRLPADPEMAAADEAVDAPDKPDTPSTPAQPQRPARPRPSPTGPAHSALVVVETADQRHIAWQPGHTCPEALDDALHDRLDASGHLAPDDDGALPLLLRLAKDAGHSVQIDPALWPLLGANRDARTRLHVLEAAYPDGAASAGLATLLRAPLPAYQADGALFAVVAGRLLMADERGLGKGVQAMAAAELWHRHFGVQRVLVLCTGDQRLAWQRAWWRFAGRSAQLVEGNANARQALWAVDADLRILSPDVLASDATALANWSPELVIVDEPQRLDGGWRHLDTPLALVLCGAALDTQPELLDALVAWLDDQRQGPLAAVRRIRAAHDSGEVLDDNAIEQISDTLSRVMLQRQRAEVAEQLPPRVLGVRQVPLAAPQRDAHAAHLATVQRLVAGWRRSGYLSDSDQWRLGQALAAAQTACHRANPADAGSPLAEATVATLDAQLADWGDTGYPMVAVLCASPADRDQLAAHFGESPGLVLCLPGEPLPEGTEVVLRIGVPWRLKNGPRTLDAVPGMPWVHLVGQASLELGLADTLAQRADVPAGLAEAGGRGYLSGAKLDAWLQAIDAALAAMAPPVGAVSSS